MAQGKALLARLVPSTRSERQAHLSMVGDKRTRACDLSVEALLPALKAQLGLGGLAPGKYLQMKHPSSGHSVVDLLRWQVGLGMLLSLAPGGYIKFTCLREAMVVLLSLDKGADPFSHRGATYDMRKSGEKLATTIRTMMSHIVRMSKQPSRLSAALRSASSSLDAEVLKALVGQVDRNALEPEDLDADGWVQVESDDMTEAYFDPREPEVLNAVVLVEDEYSTPVQPHVEVEDGSVCSVSSDEETVTAIIDLPRVRFCDMGKKARKAKKSSAKVKTVPVLKPHKTRALYKKPSTTTEQLNEKPAPEVGEGCYKK